MLWIIGGLLILWVYSIWVRACAHRTIWFTTWFLLRAGSWKLGLIKQTKPDPQMLTRPVTGWGVLLRGYLVEEFQLSPPPFPLFGFRHVSAPLQTWCYRPDHRYRVVDCSPRGAWFLMLVRRA